MAPKCKFFCSLQQKSNASTLDNILGLCVAALMNVLVINGGSNGLNVARTMTVALQVEATL